jgi:hypothetical protein
MHPDIHPFFVELGIAFGAAAKYQSLRFLYL